ncbi:MAG: hypothetical protein V4693_22010 [Pseudomonadota bacterium]
MPTRIESPDQPDVIKLTADLDAYQDSLYPAESRYALDLTSLKQPAASPLGSHLSGRA